MARAKHSQAWLWSIQLAGIDVATLLFCGVISSEVRNYGDVFPNFTVSDGLLVLAICMTGLTIIGGYERTRNLCSLSYASEHVLAMGAVLLFAFVFTYVFSAYNDSTKPGRSVLFLGLILFAPLSLAYRRILSRKAGREAEARFIYVLGTPELATELEAICKRARIRNPLRFIKLAPGVGEGKDVPGDDDLAWKELKSASMTECEGVVIDLAYGRMKPEWEEFLLRTNLHTVPVYPVETFIETYFHKIELKHVTLSWALDGTFNADHHSAYGKLKGLIDVVLGTFLFIALLPLMILTALVIKLTDKGPALFRQVRVGRFGRPFLLYKFRTMTVSKAEHENLYTQERDHRITKIGRFLRLTRIDELPQLWNVVRGDMSLIGPRAEWDRLVDKYKDEIPFYHLRHMVKPGITGWAQVNYGYGASVSDAFEKLQYDLYYIKYYSPQMDASIILKTLFTIMSASGR